MDSIATDGFRVRWPRHLPPLSNDEGLRVVEGDVQHGHQEANLAEWSGILKASTFDEIRPERCAFKAYQVYLEKEGRHAYARLHATWSGKHKNGTKVSYESEAEGRLVATPEGWLFDRLRFQKMRKLTYASKGFVDVSSLAGIGLFRSPERERSLFAHLGNVNIMNTGGLAVWDWNQDGALDLMVYNERSLFLLFENDGQGGFQRVDAARLIPIDEVALSYTVADLDLDGQPELIGGRPKDCGTSRARFPIYKVVKEKLTEVGSGLPHAADCRQAMYADIAVQDYDGDGRPDLYFSNYGLKHSRLATNQFDAQDGGQDLLFRNLGDLRFEDTTMSAGIGVERRRTWVARWHDYDDDGDLDLLALNDFGPAAFYRNDGQGRLTAGAYPPLTDRAFGMGLSIADYDNDGDFDLYVSKMYSYAGQRVLAVTADVTGETHRELMAMATGNALYRNDGGGRYVDVAPTMGVNNGRWAWGNVAFDYDNDGDRDLFVTNGLASNLDPRAPDH